MGGETDTFRSPSLIKKKSCQINTEEGWNIFPEEPRLITTEKFGVDLLGARPVAAVAVSHRPPLLAPGRAQSPVDGPLQSWLTQQNVSRQTDRTGRCVHSRCISSLMGCVTLPERTANTIHSDKINSLLSRVTSSVAPWGEKKNRRLAKTTKIVEIQVRDGPCLQYSCDFSLGGRVRFHSVA